MIALGRKNWLFVGSQQAGERAAVVLSLIESAKLNGHDPWAYLKDVFERLPTLTNSELATLLPHNWRPAAKADAANSAPVASAAAVAAQRRPQHNPIGAARVSFAERLGARREAMWSMWGPRQHRCPRSRSCQPDRRQWNIGISRDG